MVVPNGTRRPAFDDALFDDGYGQPALAWVTLKPVTGRTISSACTWPNWAIRSRRSALFQHQNYESAKDWGRD